MKKPTRRLRLRWQRLGRVVRTKAVTIVYRRMAFVARDLTGRALDLSGQIPFTVTEMSEADLPSYLGLRRDQDEAEIRQRLSSGDRCYVSWHGAEVVETTWVAKSRGPVPYLGGFLLLAPGDLFVYDSFTAPAHRGRGLYAAKLWHIFRLSRQAGLRRNVAVVAVENLAPLKIIKRFGGAVLGHYHCVKIGPWRRVLARPVDGERLPSFVAERGRP